MATPRGPCAYDTNRLPVFAGRRNGCWPSNGLKLPIGMPGNAGLNDGVSAPLDSDFVIVASRCVYEAANRTRPTCASAEVSMPFAVNDWEFTFALVTCAATSTGMPNWGSNVRLTDSTRS